MESKLKAECMDQSGELYENMLLKEGGFPHLPNPVFLPEPKTKQAIVGLLENKSDACKDCGGKGWIFSGFGEDHECETCFDKSPESENIVEKSQSDAWNDAGTKPDHPCLCETRHNTNDKNPYFQYFNGDRFGFACGGKDQAIKWAHLHDPRSQHVQWREVQS